MGSVAPAAVNFIDIRRDKTESSLLTLIEQSLDPQDGSPPSLPTLLLYDEKGLKIFQDITYLDEYYLTNVEIGILTAHADAIAAQIPHNARLIELGSGNLRKVKILLDAFERSSKAVEYFALDLSYSELQRTFAQLDLSSYQYVSFGALHGTYDDGLTWLSSLENEYKVNCILTLGSSLGNFTREEAAEFLSRFKNALRPSDYLIIGLDSCQDPKRVYTAYNDKDGITEHFYRNGLHHANQVLGSDVFKQDDWEIETEYDEVHHFHHTSIVPKKNVTIAGKEFHAGQKIHYENAFKYSQEQRDQLWHNSGLILQALYGNNRDDYHLSLLSPSIITFPDSPNGYAATPAPSLKDWQQLWSAWDTVTRAMVPRDELMNKPIKLRNTLIFYLGHIPTFADIHYTRATGAKPTDPAYYYSIFERGIDPDVDDPDKCHDHSVIPDEWPQLQDILEYSAKVRARITNSVESGAVTADRKLGRSLWLAFEHEAMHLETFLYMLLQSERVLPPPGQEIPDFVALASKAANDREINSWHRIPTTQLEIGIDDPENDLAPDRYFGWDNERPARATKIPSFEAQSRPISNGEYAYFLESTNAKGVPASWIEKVSDIIGSQAPIEEEVSPASFSFVANKAIRTVYGPVPLQYALDWPVMASYDELAAYASWVNGRIPTFEETRSIYHYVESQKKKVVEGVSSSLISAVNGHLCNDGVEETPPFNPLPPKPINEDELKPQDVFIDLAGCNVGLKNWHPTPVTGDGSRLRGQGDLGGLWEWTSSPLAHYEGFKAMDLYPGYTSDFFDNKHNICLGGSWATVPRIAGRKSFVNWYQRNYPFTWATARIVRDVKQDP